MKAVAGVLVTHQMSLKMVSLYKAVKNTFTETQLAPVLFGRSPSLSKRTLQPRKATKLKAQQWSFKRRQLNLLFS